MNPAVIGVRCLWILSQIISLIAVASSPLAQRHRMLLFYLAISTLTAIAFWPELFPGWYAAWWPWLLATCFLRVAAMLEALHKQMRDCPAWSQVMGGSIVLGLAGLGIVWSCSGDVASQAVELRRSLQIWTACTMVAACGFFYVIDGWRKAREDCHVILFLVLCLTHGAVSVMYLYRPDVSLLLPEHRAAVLASESQYWQTVNLVATGINSLVCLGWSMLFGWARPLRIFGASGRVYGGRFATAKRPRVLSAQQR